MLRVMIVVAITSLPACNAILGIGDFHLDRDAATVTDAPSDAALSAIAQRAYIKASNTQANDAFGQSIAVSADGSTLAVGAIGEDSAAIGINGNQADNAATSAGAVYVFTRSGTTWIQQAYVKGSNTETMDTFGQSVALSADGSTLAVGARFESSAATGVNGNQASNTAMFAGAVYVFTRAGTTWTQQAYVKASNTEAVDQFGVALALSADGATLAVGASGEDSAATGINGNQTDNSATFAGAVYVFARVGLTWTQQAYVKASNTDVNDSFGLRAIALSTDGSTLAVGVSDESSAATGIGGNQADNSATGAGAVYVFSRAGTTWTQQAYVKASNTQALDQFGVSIALSGDGSTLAVGALGEDSAVIGIDGDQTNNAASAAGATYVFTRAGTTWAQQAYLKASNTETDDQFGTSVALSSDGSTLVVGAPNEDSAATGIGGSQVDNSVQVSGAVYVFTRAGTTWTQEAYVKASNTDLDDHFGFTVVLSGTGSTLAVVAPREASAATGVDGNQGDDSAAVAGAVYVFQ
jgi:hypothetical protein